MNLKHLVTKLIAVFFTGICWSPAFAQTITVMVGGGAYGDGQIEAYARPFEQATGIKVVAIKDQMKLSKLKLMVENNNVDVDVFSIAQADGIVAARNGYLQNLDYSIYNADELKGIPEAARTPWGMPSLYYAYVLGLNSTKFPEGSAAPQSWADFWNFKKFPGTRVMQSGVLGSEGPWEEALLADGVPVDKLYPMDIDRIFKSLDKIRPQIRKWWTVGSENQQLFADNVAELGMSYDGRIAILKAAGKPVRAEFNQAKINWSSWVIPKGAPNAVAAQKFIEFASRAKQQAIFATRTSYGPTNLNAFSFIDKNLAKSMTSYPQNVKKAYFMNVEWYSQVGSDGKTNADRLIQRWNEWSVKQ